MNNSEGLDKSGRSDCKALGSRGEEMRAVVIGARGGIGAALVSRLAECSSVSLVHALSREGLDGQAPKVVGGTINIEDENSIAAAALSVGAVSGSVDLIILATGLLHDKNGIRPEKSWKSLDGATLERTFRVNTIGPALLAKHFIPLLNRKKMSIFAALSARVGSIEDNKLGGWDGYRASKAGLNMMIRGLAIELSRTHPKLACVALHPGTVDTNLSQPFQRSVPGEQLKSAETCAFELLNVIEGLSPGDTGKFIAYDGTQIPF